MTYMINIVNLYFVVDELGSILSVFQFQGASLGGRECVVGGMKQTSRQSLSSEDLDWTGASQ